MPAGERAVLASRVVCSRLGKSWLHIAFSVFGEPLVAFASKIYVPSQIYVQACTLTRARAGVYPPLDPASLVHYSAAHSRRALTVAWHVRCGDIVLDHRCLL